MPCLILLVHPRTNAPPPPPNHPSSFSFHALSPPLQAHTADVVVSSSAMPQHDDGAARVPQPRPSRGRQPSFSAALLDAIYHSLEADADAADARRASTESESRRTRTPAPPSSSPPQRAPSRRRTTPPELSPSPSRSSARSPRLQRTPRPCRVRPDPLPDCSNNGGSLLPPPPLPPPHPHEPSAGDRRGADAEKKRGRRRKSTRAGTAKAAPFACLLNALLCNRRPAARSSVDHTPRATAAATAFAAAPARSILSSRASRSRRQSAAATGGILTPARRAVRFSPVATVVDDDHREHGHGHGPAGAAGAATTGLRAKESAAEAERRVEELLRALGVADERERERAKESSESSSDLFELESLPAFGNRDTELPRSRTAAAAGVLARPRPRVQ